MSDPNPDTSGRLNHVLGRSHGTNASDMARLISYIEANLRLGREMTIVINKLGHWNAKDGEEARR